MRCQLFLIHLVVLLSVHQPLPAAAAGAPLSQKLTTRWCADVSLADFLETSEACQMEESLGGGADCWASLDAVLQLCLEEAAAAGQLDLYGSTDKLDTLKRNRNKFLGKRDGGARNNFLGKRDGVGRLRGIDAFFGKQLATDSGEKRNRNKFLGKRAQNDGFELDSISTEKRSRNKFLGKRSRLEDLPDRPALVVLGNGDSDKRSRNDFLGKRDQTDIKRSRNKFLGKRVQLDEK